MALAFNVQRAGPLAQVSIGPGELMVAYQLATGVYGWWKARERTESLVHLLESHQCSLSAPSSFNHTAYVRARVEHGKMTGIVVQDNAVRCVPLPKASTALPNDRGQACLRAITAAILCLYETEATTAILREIIPFALIQRELEDLGVSFDDGPLLPALREWVRSVAVEEDCDATRGYLLQQVAAKEHKLSGIPFEDVLNSNLKEQTGEIPFVIGVLKWCLTPSPQRKQTTYGTRSIRAWSMASILGSLGFEIVAAKYIAHSQPHFGSSTIPEVYIVACADIATDYLACTVHIGEAIPSVRPAVTPISGIPVLAFRRFTGQPYKLDVTMFQEAFASSFKKARTKYQEFLNDAPDDRINRLRRNELAPFHTQLWEIFMEPPGWEHDCDLLHFSSIGDHVPCLGNQADWNPDLIASFLRGEVSEERETSNWIQGNYNCNMLKAIILGTLYGMVSCFISLPRDEEIYHQDVFFLPFLASRAFLQTFCERVVKDCIETIRPLITLSILFFSLSNWKFPEMGDIASQRRGILLGVHIGGLTLLSESLVQLEVGGELYDRRYRLLRGKPLNIPTDEGGIIRAYIDRGYDSNATNIESEKKPLLKTLGTSENLKNGSTLRLDPEPFWKMDPQLVVWKIRRNGLPIATVNLWTLSKTWKRYKSCRCGQYCRSATIPSNSEEQWRQISMEELISVAPRGLKPDAWPARFLVDASTDKATTAVALAVLRDFLYVEVVWDCFQCALQELTNKESVDTKRKQSSVLLIAWTFHHRQPA
ncbi:hypothetical protein CC80DRAFT_497439 [Byssothecium circinans]|uniref:Uncharacterized protein n=1 Tax=Byssothecium circinans TaxID=147558 RepID=A0A6A5TA30_9PLEO|nr:hypothetical protein CC80DRAFT_497439 [Byssothecium circinans]